MSFIPLTTKRSYNVQEDNSFEKQNREELVIQDGEELVIQNYITSTSVVFDVGANTGSWTEAALNHRYSINVHLFEPVPQNYQNLLRNFEGRISNHNILFNNCAISDKEELKTFYYYENAPSWSTFHRRIDIEKLYNLDAPKELTVYTTTLDKYCKKLEINHINFLKVDTEGGELNVLVGANELLQKSKIDYIQFEYGGTYLDAEITLRSVYEYLNERGYAVFKILPSGLMFYSEFKEEYEDFQYSNFLAVNQRIVPIILGHTPELINLREICKECSVVPRGVIHIGAHEGHEVDDYIQMGFKKILYIEANPQVFSKLKKNVEGRPNVKTVNCAISDHDGVLTLHITSMDQSSSILPLKRHKAIYPDICETGQVEVVSRRLDTLLRELDIDVSEYNLLNIDIQGAELLALRGAVNTLKYIEAINTEINYEEMYEGCSLSSDIDDFLEHNGFTRKLVKTPYHPSWGDAFYIRRPVITMSELGQNGRFANQLFQYAFMKIYAKKYGLQFENNGWAGCFLFGHNDPPITKQLPVVRQEKFTLAEDPIAKGNPILKNVDLWGYFQYHTKFYAPYKDYFLSLFRPVSSIENKVMEATKCLREKGRTLVGIHLRRGDYGYKHFFVAPSDWYKDWLAGFWDTLEEPVLFIASDEPDKVVSDFGMYNPVLSSDLGIDLEKSKYYLDFYLLSQCDVVAISNSSFSFAACMLNEKGKMFFRPYLPEKKLIPFDPWNSEPIFFDEC